MTPVLALRGSVHVGQSRIFGGLDLSVAPGRWVTLLGASGIGKSTILRLLAGLGDGLRLTGSMVAPPPGGLALMSQQDLLLPWLSILQNTLLGARLRGQRPDTARARAILRDVGLGDLAARQPSGLSGGQRQRAALARTLMEDKPAVLLDEPFSALDAVTRRQMQDLSARLLRGRTVLHVTHDPAEAVRLADEIFVMTADGLSAVAVPPGVTPRADDTTVLRAQADLLRHLEQVAP